MRLLPVVFMAGCANSGTTLPGELWISGDDTLALSAEIGEDTVVISGESDSAQLELTVTDIHTSHTWNNEAPDGPLTAEMAFTLGASSYTEADFIWFVWTPHDESHFMGGILVEEGEYHTVRIGQTEVVSFRCTDEYEQMCMQTEYERFTESDFPEAGYCGTAWTEGTCDPETSLGTCTWAEGVSYFLTSACDDIGTNPQEFCEMEFEGTWSPGAGSCP